jgi:hypothetical protein
MKANINEIVDVTVGLNMKESGAEVLTDAFVYSKTIGKAVAAKKGLTGSEAEEYAGEVQRTLRRVRLALEDAGF